MFFYENVVVTVETKEKLQKETHCPHCSAALVRDRWIPVRYSTVTLVRVLILATACSILLWLLAGRVNIAAVLLCMFSEPVQKWITAAGCAVVGSWIGYLTVLLELKLRYWGKNQRVYGLRCKACRRAYAGIANENMRDHKEV